MKKSQKKTALTSSCFNSVVRVADRQMKFTTVLIIALVFFLMQASASSAKAQIQAWGDNSNGQLGTGIYNPPNPTPVTIGSTGDITAFGPGNHFTLAVKADGTMLAWGRNDHGQLGINSTTQSLSPVPISGFTNVVAASGGLLHSLALKSDGTVWSWGDNTAGQLGNGTTGYLLALTPIQIPNLSDIIAIDAGEHFSLALKSDGTVWAWGLNNHGQTGIKMYNKPACDCYTTPTQIPGLTGIISISAGDAHSMALKKDGSVWLWGYNYYGQLGNGRFSGDSQTPVQSSLTGITEIAAGNLYSLALKPDGTVYAWGYNNYGELGNGTRNTTDCTCVENPVQTTIADVTDIKSDGFHSLALKKDGTVWGWGDNGNGQMGNGTYGNTATTPVQSSAGSGLFTFGIGYFHSLAARPNIATSAGTNVRLGGENARVIFSSLATGGTTSFETTDPTTSGLAVPPGATILGNSQAYQLTTSAVFSPAATAEVCIKVETQYSETIFNGLKLLHGERAFLIDRTTSRNYQRRELCAVTGSLGTFIVGQSAGGVTPGVIDNSFGSNGQILMGFNNSTNASARSVFVRPNGKIVVAGGAECLPAASCIAVARYLANGTLDTTFNTHGFIRSYLSTGSNYGYAVAVKPDASITVAGESFNTATGVLNFGFSKYISTGIPDSTFSTDGLDSVNFGMTTPSFAKAIAIQPDGKIIAAGDLYVTASGSYDFAIVRLNPDGTRDYSFHGDGRITANLGGGTAYDSANSIILQPDGKIIVGGNIDDGYGMVRYNADGSTDGTFGSAGVKLYPQPSGDKATLRAMALQNDGKIVAVGEIQSAAQPSQKYFTRRYNTDGSFDSTFGASGSGFTNTDLPGYSSVQGNSIVITGQGNIVIAGYATDAASNSIFTVLCYNPNGQINTQFNYPDGRATIGFGQNQVNRAYGLALQPDGNIVVVGDSGTSSNQQFAITRFMMGNL